jgi:hypothetical protein
LAEFSIIPFSHATDSKSRCRLHLQTTQPRVFYTRHRSGVWLPRDFQKSHTILMPESLGGWPF